MVDLKSARRKGNLEQFIREHEKDAPGDADKLDQAIRRPASQKSKEAPKASSGRGSGD